MQIKRHTSGQSADNPRTTNGGVNDRNDLPKFGLKGRVEIRASLDRAEAVAICEFGEDSDIAVVFELKACDYWSLPLRSSGELVIVSYARVAMVYAL